MTNSIKKTTDQFLTDVKFELDYANWNFEANDPRAGYEDVEKAISYLSTQKFSRKKIQELLEQEWEDIVYNMRNEQVREDKAFYAAAHIADRIAYDRVYRFKASDWEMRVGTKKWYINETVTFTIR